MNINKSIAIALCSYQGEQFLREQIDSILAQSYQSFDLFIFDDGSTDASIEIINQYQQRHANIYLHQNQQRLGFVKNFEQAIKKLSSKNTYIALCDQDDIWHKDKLARCYQALSILEQQNPNLPCLVHSDLALINASGEPLYASFFAKKQIDLPKKKSLAKILGYNGVMGNTLLINHQLAQLALPFPNGLKYHDYWLALVNETFGNRKTLHFPLVYYRIHSKNSSENNKLQAKKTPPAPFTQDKRKTTLAYFLTHYDINKKDSTIIKAFYNYLDLDNNALYRMLILLKYGFLRNNLAYQLRVLRRLLVTSQKL